jgi:hypothetical protein
MIILLVIIQFYIDNLIIFGESLFIGDSENYLIRLCLKTALNINDHTDKKKQSFIFLVLNFESN